MSSRGFKYVYGPVYSWRLGISLGIDLLSTARKVCNFDCIYCQLGKTRRFTVRPGVFVSVPQIIRELNRLPEVRLDYITFSGRGEPTLAANLGQAIRAVKKLRIAPVAVLTNAGLINQARVRKSLSLADFVIVKLDACSQERLKSINRPQAAIRFRNIIRGIMQFRKEFKGRLGLQIMFLRQNKQTAGQLAAWAGEIKPDEVQINTPRRPSAARPLSRKEIFRIKQYFRGLNYISVYDAPRKRVIPLSNKQAMRRRGKRV